MHPQPEDTTCSAGTKKEKYPNSLGGSFGDFYLF